MVLHYYMYTKILISM
nr:unnamed protein product [Callosobruchus chinensis]CAH7736991.1 unnamed protein product [Callosobruchus chinensis]CAH7737691.1 unnamed protein product [Callosobruchus chinensis]CAH7755207.1 unnamed protein product [Callosobruchus chinensis]